MDIKIFRISSLRIMDLNKLVDKLNDSQKQYAVEKYENHLAQYYVEVTYKNGLYVVSNEADYYYVCKQQKLSKINVGIRSDEVDRITAHLLYRAQYEVLNPMIAALIFEELKEIGRLGQKEISEKIKKSQGAISNKKRLLKLPAFVQNELIKGTIKERHGRAILQLSVLENYEQEAENVLREIIINKLKVSDTVDLVHTKLGKEVKQKGALNLKQVESRSELKHPEVGMIIEYLKKEIIGAQDSVKSNFPNLELVLEEGLEKDDYVFLLKMKGINK